MTKGKPDPQKRAKLLNDALEAEKKHRAAIKWLMDINAFFNLFGHSGDTWKGDVWVELARVASVDKEEAVHEVVKTRKALDEARAKLEKEEFDGYF
jgi:hypothetical protein